MKTARILPPELGAAFSVADAQRLGVSPGRLRRKDLASPFQGVRRRLDETSNTALDDVDPYERQRRSRVQRAREYAPRMHPEHFYSHQTAASLWGAPLPLSLSSLGSVETAEQLPLHVSALGVAALPGVRGVARHRAQPRMTVVTERDGIRLTSPATTWASLGQLQVADLIALGDYFCRTWRPGIGRPDQGRAPLSTRGLLRVALEAGRRRGAVSLREALKFIREDSWSPRESLVRYLLVSAGLPEPELNVDLFDSAGRFLGCVDMVYRAQRVVIEYHGHIHQSTWADDVERIAALRAAGWAVIEVTAPLLKNPVELVRRVTEARDR